MSAVITRDMIEDGLMCGAIVVYYEDGNLACKIGGGWFYIDDDVDPTNYEDVVNFIFEELNDLRLSIYYGYEDEYRYYYNYLTNALNS